MEIKNDKSRNMLILTAAIALIALSAGAYFMSKNKAQNTPITPSVNTATSPNVATVPGNSPSKEYNLAQKEENEKRARQALSQGSSFEPKITNNDSLSSGSPIDKLSQAPVPQITPAAAQPVEISVVEPDMTAVAVTPTVVEPKAVPVVAAVQEKAAPRYSPEQYSLIMMLSNAHRNRGSAIETDFTGENKSNNANSNGNAAMNGANGGVMQTAANATDEGVTFMKAGDILNAVIETEINSDEPSPVLARIVGGKYNGSKAVCGIQNNGEKVLVECKKLNIPNMKKSLNVNLVAIDPQTTRTGLASEVDRHLFQKYVVGLGATFLKGYADALMRQNTTTSITTGGSVIISQGQLSGKDITKQGIGEVGRDVSQEIKQKSQSLKPTIHVKAGTAIGLMASDDIFAK